MSTTVRVPVKASIWDWVMRIGAYSNLTVADHEKSISGVLAVKILRCVKSLT